MGGGVTTVVGDGSSDGEASIDGDGDNVGGAWAHVVVGGKGAPQLLPYGVLRGSKMKLVLVGTTGSGPPAVPGPCMARAIQFWLAACQSG